MLIVAIQIERGHEAPELLDGPAVVVVRLDRPLLAEAQCGDAVQQAEFGHAESGIPAAGAETDDLAFEKRDFGSRLGLLEEIRRRQSRESSADDRHVDVDFLPEAVVRRVLPGREPVALLPEVLSFHLLDLHLLTSGYGA